MPALRRRAASFNIPCNKMRNIVGIVLYTFVLYCEVRFCFKMSILYFGLQVSDVLRQETVSVLHSQLQLYSFDLFQ